MKKVKPRTKLPPTKLNTKLLGKLSDAAMPKMPMTTMRLRGAHAKRFHSMKVGSHVRAHVKGKLMSMGMDEYNNNEPTADIQINDVAPTMDDANGGASSRLPR